ncbi:hypothetical protein OG21DRAFT_1505642 [Imleria badia]|nr:hypothetical protein OG21DRAFT_1505642 [Imleria badia]
MDVGGRSARPSLFTSGARCALLARLTSRTIRCRYVSSTILATCLRSSWSFPRRSLEATDAPRVAPDRDLEAHAHPSLTVQDIARA